MDVDTILVVITLAAGLYMAWNIGANDVANAIGTSVGSGALTLKQAVVIAAVLEFCGAFFFGSHVTDTVQNGLVNPEVFSSTPMIFVFGMLSALLAAGIWLQLASYFGWPVSTTHSIVGAIVGFGLIVGGMDAIYWSNVAFITVAWLLSPIFGGVLAYIIFNILRKYIFFAACPVDAAKRLTPYIVFVFVTTLSVIMLFKGLEGVRLPLTLWQLAMLCLAIGIVASLISYFLVRRISLPNKSVTHPPEFSPETLYSLEKVKKHLKKVRNSSSGEMQYHASLLLDDVRHLVRSSQQQEEVHTNEYAVVEKIFGRMQIMSACAMAFAHGANDVANAIGPLSAAINVLMTGTIALHTTSIPTWALALGGVGIIVGLATWGWRVIETIGRKITELTPTRGFSAEFGAALTIVFASRMGLPVSTTHTLVGAVLGVGLARGIEALNLNTTRDIFISWVVTVPAGAAISCGCFFILNTIFTS
ncbi:MAG: inorganic phosphate transporter [Chlamydiia bacterium]|nr:inorganic phosphate transporter [Chlamydiia bacterium]